jgi:methylphosphotriester-DNA--protein-cysteine methyltransferase
MRYLKHVPSSVLRDAVDYLWLLSDAPAHGRELIVPSGTFELVINLHDDGLRIYASDGIRLRKQLKGVGVSGAFSRPFAIDTADHALIMGVHFRPGGAFPFLGIGAHELADAHTEGDALWGAAAGRLRERLRAAPTHESRFGVLEEELLALRSQTSRGAVLLAVQLLADGRTRVEEVVRGLGLSHRRFIDIFACEVGMTPKLFFRVRRFQRVLATVKAPGAAAWTRVAFDAGYFDQPHLVHDFTAFCGMPPTAYLRRRDDRVKDGHLAIG